MDDAIHKKKRYDDVLKLIWLAIIESGEPFTTVDAGVLSKSDCRMKLTALMEELMEIVKSMTSMNEAPPANIDVLEYTRHAYPLLRVLSGDRDVVPNDDLSEARIRTFIANLQHYGEQIYKIQTNDAQQRPQSLGVVGGGGGSGGRARANVPKHQMQPISNEKMLKFKEVVTRELKETMDSILNGQKQMLLPRVKIREQPVATTEVVRATSKRTHDNESTIEQLRFELKNIHAAYMDLNSIMANHLKQLREISTGQQFHTETVADREAYEASVAEASDDLYDKCLRDSSSSPRFTLLLLAMARNFNLNDLKDFISADSNVMMPKQQYTPINISSIMGAIYNSGIYQPRGPIISRLIDLKYKNNSSRAPFGHSPLGMMRRDEILVYSPKGIGDLEDLLNKSEQKISNISHGKRGRPG